jgi:hypothetical protein
MTINELSKELVSLKTLALEILKSRGTFMAADQNKQVEILIMVEEKIVDKLLSERHEDPFKDVEAKVINIGISYEDISEMVSSVMIKTFLNKK